MEFKTFSYLAITLLCLLDILTTLLCILWLRLPVENETNRMFQLLIKNNLWVEYFVVNSMKIFSLWLGLNLIYSNMNRLNRLAKELIVTGLLFLFSYPVVNNAIAILLHINL